MAQINRELLRYRRIIIIAGLVLGLMWLLLLMCAYFLNRPALIDFIMGAFLSSMLSVLNVLALGYAAYGLLIKKTSRTSILWPVASFVALVAGALAAVRFYPSLAFGYAIGLVSPLLLGAFIAFLHQPLDRA